MFRMEPITILVSIIATAGAIIITGFACFGLHQAIILQTMRKFIGTSKTVTIPVVDTAIRRGGGALIHLYKQYLRIREIIL